MPEVDLGALTIPIFAAIFSAGWSAYHLFIGRPLSSRVEKLEAKLDAIEQNKEAELTALRKAVYG